MAHIERRNFVNNGHWHTSHGSSSIDTDGGGPGRLVRERWERCRLRSPRVCAVGYGMAHTRSLSIPILPLLLFLTFLPLALLFLPFCLPSSFFLSLFLLPLFFLLGFNLRRDLLGLLPRAFSFLLSLFLLLLPALSSPLSSFGHGGLMH